MKSKWNFQIVLSVYLALDYKPVFYFLAFMHSFLKPYLFFFSIFKVEVYFNTLSVKKFLAKS